MINIINKKQTCECDNLKCDKIKNNNYNINICECDNKKCDLFKNNIINICECNDKKCNLLLKSDQNYNPNIKNIYIKNWSKDCECKNITCDLLTNNKYKIKICHCNDPNCKMVQILDQLNICDCKVDDCQLQGGKYKTIKIINSNIIKFLKLLNNSDFIPFDTNKIFYKFAQLNNLIYIPITGDGNCQLKAFSVAYANFTQTKPPSISVLRNLIGNYMIDHINFYQTIFEDEAGYNRSIQQWITDFSAPSSLEYGTDITLSILSILYKIDIILYSIRPIKKLRKNQLIYQVNEKYFDKIIMGYSYEDKHYVAFYYLI